MTKASDNVFPRFLISEGGSTSTPAANRVTIYAKSDGLLYSKDDAGTETLVSGGAGGLTDHTHAATGSGATGGGATLNPTAFKLPTATGAITTTEGYIGYDSDDDLVKVYDGQRERIISTVGWTPYIDPMYEDYGQNKNSDQALPINGGSVVIPMVCPAHALIERLSYRNVDAASTRTMEWRLYQQPLNNGNSGENTLNEVAGANGTASFTGAGATNLTSTAASAPVYVPPGVYWLAIRNTSASQTFGLGYIAPASGVTHQLARTKTLGSSLGSTLDFVAASWSGSSRIYQVRFDCRVFGMTAAL